MMTKQIVKPILPLHNGFGVYHHNTTVVTKVTSADKYFFELEQFEQSEELTDFLIGQITIHKNRMNRSFNKPNLILDNLRKIVDNHRLFIKEKDRCFSQFTDCPL